MHGVRGRDRGGIAAVIRLVRLPRPLADPLLLVPVSPDLPEDLGLDVGQCREAPHRHVPELADSCRFSIWSSVSFPSLARLSSIAMSFPRRRGAALRTQPHRSW